MSHNEGRMKSLQKSRAETSAGSEFLSLLRISEFTQNFWFFSFYIADFWQTFWVIWDNGSNQISWKVEKPQCTTSTVLHPNSTMFKPLDRLQLKIYAFSGKFNVCSKCVLLSRIKICRDFTLQTQIFTQKYRSWLRFYSEFLRKIWWLKSLVQSTPLNSPPPPPPAPYQPINRSG